MESPIIRFYNIWAAVCFVFLLCLLWASWIFKRKQCGTNQSPYHWPLAGMLPSLLWNSSRLPEWLTEVLWSLGDGVGSFTIEGPIFSKLIYLVTCHPENMEYILKTNFSNYPKGSDFKEIFDILGNGILNDDGDSWSTQRRMINVCFRSDEFRSVFRRIAPELVESELLPFMCHVVSKGSIIDLQEICTRFAFDTNMSVIFGEQVRSLSTDLPRNELADAMHDAHDAVLYRHVMPMFFWKTLRFLNVGREKNLAEARKTIDFLVGEYISSNREILNKGKGRKVNLISMLLKSSSDALDDKYVRDIMVNLFFAGTDTLSSALVWFFWMVAKAPHAEKKILEELESVARKKNASWPCLFDAEELKGLVYLHAALCESLRLNPPLPLNSKGVLKEDVLPDGTVVKPGMQIIISYFAEGKMPWIWGKDSLEFKPERWIDAEGKLHRELSSKFFAFNVGPRSCLGKDIAFIQMKLCVAAVLYNFHVKLVGGSEVCSKPSINLHMKNELLVHIQRRDM